MSIFLFNDVPTYERFTSTLTNGACETSWWRCAIFGRQEVAIKPGKRYSTPFSFFFNATCIAYISSSAFDVPRLDLQTPFSNAYNMWKPKLNFLGLHCHVTISRYPFRTPHLPYGQISTSCHVRYSHSSSSSHMETYMPLTPSSSGVAEILSLG